MGQTIGRTIAGAILEEVGARARMNNKLDVEAPRDVRTRFAKAVTAF